MLHDGSAGSERLTLIIADTKDHNIAADLCILTGIEVDEDATVAGHFNGGNSLPASIGVFETFFIRIKIRAGARAGSFLIVVASCNNP